MKLKKLPQKRFISEPITVSFTNEPQFSKRPPCPDSFTWRNEVLNVKTCLAEWKDFSRKDRMEKNMQPQHAISASQKGSWGVGKFYFDVQVQDGRLFRIYYDRAPKDALDRKGLWMLLAELDTPGNQF